MKVVIIEDEQIAAENLLSVIAEVDPTIEVMAILQSVKEAVAWLQLNHPDLVFMDIHLADNLSFSIFDQVQVRAPLIFTTAYDHYAVKAFKLNSIDYLLKPIEASELKHALDKFHQLAPYSASEVKSLMSSLQQAVPGYQKRFMVSSGNKIRSVQASQVALFYAEGRYVMMLMDDGHRHVSDYTLDKLENILDPSEFFRINRAMIVRFNAIGQMQVYTKSRIKIELTVDPGFETIVSIDRSGTFKKWLSR
jgi:two-component system response regulator LytT